MAIISVSAGAPCASRNTLNAESMQRLFYGSNANNKKAHASLRRLSVSS
ncbi:hypothetical protein [Stenotrophomonas sp.]|nr:hypothetical protein [Stenotrophomonas sp.]